jgi:hypothetical protein
VVNHVPDVEQSMRALASANRVRTARKQLKERLALGEEDARELLREVPPWLSSAEIMDFLTWIPKVGEVKARKIVAKAMLNPSRTLSALTERQRQEVASLLPYREE